MTTTVTRPYEANVSPLVLHLALELSEKTWLLAFTIGLGQKPRRRWVAGGDIDAVLREIELAKWRFRVPQEVRVVSCYEAGMEGFWVHRALTAAGIENHVVDSSSIDVKRGRRRAKTDRIDAGKLVVKLVQFVAGDAKVWSVVRVPPEEAEDVRRNERELDRLKTERTALTNAIKGLLKTQGIRLGTLRHLDRQLAELQTWKGVPLGAELKAELTRMWERVQLLARQTKQVEERRGELLAQQTVIAAKAQQLMMLKSLGATTSWILATELFGWRTFSNRRQLGGLVGLWSVPTQSGSMSYGSGIAKAGRPALRATLVELAWMWVRYQPTSALTKWFEQRFANGGKRLRRIGIVALARKLLIELWKYLETAAVPEGALMKTEAPPVTA
jgi:transposase